MSGKKLNVSSLKASDIMSKEVTLMTPDMRCVDIMKALIDKKVSGAPVVDPGMKGLLSVVSEIDLMKIAAAGGMQEQLIKHMDKLATGKELMILRANDPFSEVFKIFLSKPIRRIPVVDAGFKVQGIIARRDVIKAMLEKDSAT